MRKILGLIIVLASAIVMCGCSSSVQTQIDTLQDQYDSLEKDYKKLKKDLLSLEERYGALEEDYNALKGASESETGSNQNNDEPVPTQEGVYWNIADVEKYSLGEMVTNLKVGNDGMTHYAVINASLTINTADNDYKTLGPKIEILESDFRSIFINQTAQCSYEEILTSEKKEELKTEILGEIQTFLGSRVIVDITVDYLLQ